jgi:hypothetical protein
MAIHPNIDEMVSGAVLVPERFAPNPQTDLLKMEFLSAHGMMSGTSFAATAENKRTADAPHKQNEGIRAALAYQTTLAAAENNISNLLDNEFSGRMDALAALLGRPDVSREDKISNAAQLVNDAAEVAQEQDPNLKAEDAAEIGLEQAKDKFRKEGKPEAANLLEQESEAILKQARETRATASDNSYTHEQFKHITANNPGAALVAEAAKLRAVHGTDDLSSLGFSDQKLIQLAKFKEEQSAAIHERIEKLPEQLKNSQKILDDLNASKNEIKSLVADNPELRNFFNEELAELKTSIESQTAKIEFEEAAVEYVDKHGDEIKGLSAQELFSKVMAENPELIDQYKSLATASQGEIQAFATAHGIKPEELAAAYEQAQEMQEVMALTSQTISIMAQYDTRHGFIQSNLSLVDYITTADPITDEKGNMVYSDPDTNRLYHLEANEDGSIKLDENGGVTRAYYDNPLEISQLRAEAWNPDDVKFFANETTQGYDPENGFSSTLLSTLSNEDAIAAANEDASGAVGDTDLSDPENNRNLAQVEAYKSAMEGLNGASSMSFDDLELLADKFGLDGDATTRLRASMETKGVSFTDATNTPDEKPNAPELTEPQLAVAEPKDPALSTPGMNG